MPRKPKIDKVKITVVVGGEPVSVVLHPPTISRRSWFAYPSGSRYLSIAPPRGMMLLVTRSEHHLISHLLISLYHRDGETP
jgi:hypothetical protein